MALDLAHGITDTAGALLSAHGPAGARAAKSYAPGDFSVHFFPQLAAILLACRLVDWAGEAADAA